MKILITSGGTKIPIDLVRSITNMSRGTFGSKICDMFYKTTPIDTEITFMYAKDSRMPELFQTMGPAIKPVRTIEYKTFDDYRNVVIRLLSEEKFDIICLAAAVSDYGVEQVFNGKYRSRDDEMVIKLVKLPKVISDVRRLNPDAMLCGFKLLVNSSDDELRAAMNRQFEENSIDICVGNDLRDIKANDHRLTLKNRFEDNFAVYTKSSCDLPKKVVDECMRVWKMKTGKIA